MSLNLPGHFQSPHEVIDTVARHGWACMHITDGRDDPPFSYTVGLFRTFSQPELIVFGLTQEKAHAVFSRVVEGLQEGFSLDASAEYTLFQDFACRLLEVSVDFYPHYVGHCREYYHGDRFPLLQVAWLLSPDGYAPEGALVEGHRGYQPVLGRPLAGL